MKQVIIFAGTTEGRLLGRQLAESGIETCVCVATEYGRQMVEEQEHLSVRQGRMEQEAMERLFLEEEKPLVIDATHPYAVVVSRNIREACEAAGTEYMRLIRDSEMGSRKGDCIVVSDVDEAVDFLQTTQGPVLVTTGSKELHKFTRLEDFQERVFARVLATPEVVEHCTGLGFTGSHLICMQGPFSAALNEAMLRQFKAAYLVTKESGKAGGFGEKLEAAARAGARVVLIGRPPEQQGSSYSEVQALLADRFDQKRQSKKRLVQLIGIGMGVPEHMTGEAVSAFAAADCILGAGRMLEPLGAFAKPVLDTYDPKEMLAFAEEHPEYERIAVALSGDVGFYSGARRLLAVFDKEGYEVELLAGISSVAYLCSRLQISWEDVKLLSLHGRNANLVAAVRRYPKTFTLLSGRGSVNALCRELLDYGLGEVRVWIGERLHYPDEKLTQGKPEELLGQEFDSLSVALVENPGSRNQTLSCIGDEEFIRGKAPMTKSEIRSLSVAKLRLSPDSLVYDIGAGTGSVSIEMALQADEGFVWAIERKEEAAGLIEQNMKKFKASNIQVIRGLAPEALKELPAPTHAFIGGSSGNLRELLLLLLKKNPRVRIVINAVTLETIGEAAGCLKSLPFTDVEVVQVQISKAKELGSYQLMTGQNPVYIFTCQGEYEKRDQECIE